MNLMVHVTASERPSFEAFIAGQLNMSLAEAGIKSFNPNGTEYVSAPLLDTPCHDDGVQHTHDLKECVACTVRARGIAKGAPWSLLPACALDLQVHSQPLPQARRVSSGGQHQYRLPASPVRAMSGPLSVPLSWALHVHGC